RRRPPAGERAGPWSLAPRGTGLAGEGLDHLEDGRTEKDDEESREDAADHREEHLERRLLALLLGALPAAAADLLGLDAQHVGDADAQLLRLDDRLEEVVQLGDAVAAAHVVERLEAGPAQTDLVEHLREL